MKFKVLGVVILVGVAMQFVPYGREHTNPPVAGEPQWDSQRTHELFVRTCGNCHSNKTVWPWYSRIAPVSWLIQSDVDEGREHFNGSMWGIQQKNKGADASQEVKDGEMPPWFYVLGHREAKLTENEKSELIRGLSATFGGKGEKSGR